MKLICAVFLFMGVTVSAAPATPSDPAPQILRCWDNKDQNGGDPGFVLEQSEHSAAIYFVLISILSRLICFYQPLAAWSGNGLSSGPGPGSGDS